MKKFISIILSSIIAIICLAPFNAFAAENVIETNAKYDFTVIENDESISIEGTSLYSSNLIIRNNLSIKKDGTTLKITGLTEGSSEVVKCGFTKVVIQRKKSSSTSWSNYKTYKDLYSDSTKYNLRKSITVEKGYQYRVTATHYAKKSLLSTQKIEVTTGSLTF